MLDEATLKATTADGGHESSAPSVVANASTSSRTVCSQHAADRGISPPEQFHDDDDNTDLKQKPSFSRSASVGGGPGGHAHGHERLKRNSACEPSMMGDVGEAAAGRFHDHDFLSKPSVALRKLFHTEPNLSGRPAHAWHHDIQYNSPTRLVLNYEVVIQLRSR